MEELNEIKITKYMYLDENNEQKHYFIGGEIAKLIGYQNTSEIIQLNVSEQNKILFKNYLGVKEPKINGKKILINKNGIYEILNKNRKTLSDEAINSLKDIDIAVKIEDKKKEIVPNTEDDDKTIIKEELTTYSYFFDHIYFEYFVSYEIAALLGYKNTTSIIQNNVSKSNQIEFKNYPGIKEPELKHNTILITRDGVIELLIKTRKRISPDVAYILKKFNIDTTNRKCLTKEQQTLSTITNVFKTEKFEDQYKIGTYYLDLYFSEYKIVIECDENGHADRKPWKERERMDYVNDKLEIDDSHWIRFNPDEHDFDISRVIGRIYRKIDELKEEEMKKREEQYLRLLEEEKSKIKVEDVENWDIEVEVRTGRFIPPSKEELVNKLKKYRTVAELRRRYNISATPIEKWIRDYEIDMKEYDLTIAPEKEVLINICSKHETRTAVGNHFGISVHVLRRWLENYSIDFDKVCKKKTKVNKEELVKLTNELSDKEISEKLDIPVFKTVQLLKSNSIEHIPSKEELEVLLEKKSKEEIAIHYNTCRTTLRSWIKLRGLEDIRCKVRTNRPISVINEDNVIKIYSSVKELCKELKMTPSTIRKFANTNERYNGYLFKDEKEYITESETEEEEEIEEEIIVKQIKDPKLVVYTHVNEEGEEIKYFFGKQIAEFIGVKDTTQCIRGIVSEKNKIIFKDYPGKKEPKIHHRSFLITKDGVKEILSKSRKLMPEIVDILNKYLK